MYVRFGARFLGCTFVLELVFWGVRSFCSSFSEVYVRFGARFLGCRVYVRFWCSFSVSAVYIEIRKEHIVPGLH